MFNVSLTADRVPRRGPVGYEVLTAKTVGSLPFVPSVGMVIGSQVVRSVSFDPYSAVFSVGVEETDADTFKAEGRTLKESQDLLSFSFLPGLLWDFSS